MITIERPGRFATFLIISCLLLTAVIAAISWFVFGLATVKRSGALEVSPGSAASAIWYQAASQGYTTNTIPWRFNAWRSASDNDIKAGTYQLTAGEKVSAVVARLVAGEVNTQELSVTFPEGFTNQQMAARVAARGVVTEDEFIQAASPALYGTEFSFLPQIPPGRDLEGYLFPDTYRLFINDTPSDIIKRMLANFDKRFSADLAAEVVRRGRSIDDVVIMASIIEREVQSDEDMALVAGVLWSRFDDGAGLAADATVRYALDKWDQPLTVEDLALESPYNTRRFAGLPPGPISNPGLRAIIAAVRPEDSDYYYYLSTPEGQTIFSRTLDEHNQNKAKYLR